MEKHTPPLPADLVRKHDEQGCTDNPSTKISDQTVIDSRFDAVTVVGARFDDVTVVAANNVTQPRLDDSVTSEAPRELEAVTLARHPRVLPLRHAWPPAWVVVLTVLFFFAAGAMYWQMHLLLKACSPAY